MPGLWCFAALLIRTKSCDRAVSQCDRAVSQFERTVSQFDRAMKFGRDGRGFSC